MELKSLIIFTFSLFFSSLYCFAEDIDNLNKQLVLNSQALDSYNNGDYEKALTLYKNSADLGNAEAQFNLWLLYSNGIGTQQDIETALSFLNKSAQQGYPQAEATLGGLYLFGNIVSQDFNEAIKWIRKSAEKNCPDGEFSLGFCYANGLGINPDIKESAQWIKKAAEQGHREAQYWLGNYYLNGQGVFRDNVEALNCFNKAAEQGHPGAQCNLGYHYKLGLGVEKNYTEASNWFKKAADQGFAEAQWNLGSLYQYGYGVEQNDDLSFAYYKMAADQGFIEAEASVGECYTMGYGVNQSYEEAFKWFLKAAEHGLAKSQFTVYSIYKEGIGVNLNMEEALNWLKKSADNGWIYAQQELEFYQSLGYDFSELSEDNDLNVDKVIPNGVFSASKSTHAVIIENEDYHNVKNVPYAKNDGNIFEKYLIHTVGIPKENIKKYENASYGNIAAALKHIENLSEAFGDKLNLIFYYTGHGMADEKTKQALLLPVDGDASIPETCYELEKLYEHLGNLNANSVIVLLDACFNGSIRGEGMLLDSRGVKIKSDISKPIGNMVVLTATQGDETAFPCNNGEHGMFTYFLLKKLQENKGDVTIGELTDYIVENVKQESINSNGKLQTPKIYISPQMETRWKNLKFGRN